MCLSIDRLRHAQRLPIPRVAGYDILVYKGLYNADNARAYSPYMGHEWVFGQVQTARMKRKGFEVHDGLHACHTQYRAKFHASYVYPAIIPAGSLFYFGQNEEFTSNALVVYRDMDHALKGRVQTPANAKLHKLSR